MLALEAMASGPPVDEQKEKRWPNQTPANNVKVELKEWQEDSDFSDTEGIMGYNMRSSVSPPPAYQESIDVANQAA